MDRKKKYSILQKGSISLSLIGLGVLVISAIALPLVSNLVGKRTTTQQRATGPCSGTCKQYCSTSEAEDSSVTCPANNYVCCVSTSCTNRGGTCKQYCSTSETEDSSLYCPANDYVCCKPDSSVPTSSPTPTTSGQCTGINYTLTPENPSPNTSVEVKISRSGATPCAGNWNNVGLKLDGIAQGLSADGTEGYKATINSGSLGTHTLQFSVGSSCSCNSHAFTTSALQPTPTLPTCDQKCKTTYNGVGGSCKGPGFTFGCSTMRCGGNTLDPQYCVLRNKRGEFSSSETSCSTGTTCYCFTCTEKNCGTLGCDSNCNCNQATTPTTCSSKTCYRCNPWCESYVYTGTSPNCDCPAPNNCDACPAVTVTPTLAPVHHVDQPQAGGSYSGPFHFSGWSGGGGIVKVQFYMDLPKGSVGMYGEAMANLYRPDLTAPSVLPYANTGWNFYPASWSTAGGWLTPGTHKLYTYAVKSDGTQVGSVIERTFTVTAAIATLPASSCPWGNWGDLNCDNAINMTDLTMLITKWGTTGVFENSSFHKADIAPGTGDGTVNMTDLTKLIMYWGHSGPTPR